MMFDMLEDQRRRRDDVVQNDLVDILVRNPQRLLDALDRIGEQILHIFDGQIAVVTGANGSFEAYSKAAAVLRHFRAWARLKLEMTAMWIGNGGGQDSEFRANCMEYNKLTAEEDFGGANCIICN
ncbi:hypothetical protein ACFO1S_01810 [Cohnella boryungensis]|uniref:Uncharacterized protein n=1 Tax=Cohnella boryungensis TaxID=768479 RepID=A0ABV8S5K4_9BACL